MAEKKEKKSLIQKLLGTAKEKQKTAISKQQEEINKILKKPLDARIK